MADDEIFAKVAETGDRAHEKPCILISVGHQTTYQFDSLLHQLALEVARSPQVTPFSRIVDCSRLIANALSQPALYMFWISRVGTPGLFSLTCVCEHVRKQMVEGAKTVMSIFNDTGKEGDSGDAVAAGTYMVVFKKIDVEKMRCVPVSFSTKEKNAMRYYVEKFPSGESIE
jgi:hypothetical protein